MKIYLSGPMTGLPERNYPAFHSCAAMLHEQGHEVINPAELFDGDKTRDYHEYMRANIQGLMECDAIVAMSGWQGSRGASMEVAIAEVLGMRILLMDGSQIYPKMKCVIAT